MKKHIKFFFILVILFWVQSGYSFDYIQNRSDLLKQNSNIRNKISTLSPKMKSKYTRIELISQDIDNQFNNGDWDQMRGLIVVLKGLRKNISDRNILSQVNVFLDTFNRFAGLKISLSDQTTELILQIDNLRLKGHSPEMDEILSSWESSLVEIHNEVDSNYLSLEVIKSLSDDLKNLLADSGVALSSRTISNQQKSELRKLMNQLSLFQETI